MFRWYCWLIFFAITIFSTRAFPTDGTDDLTTENPISVEGDIDEEGEIIDDGALDVTDRRFRPYFVSSTEDFFEGPKQLQKKCVCYYGKKPYRYYYLIGPFFQPRKQGGCKVVICKFVAPVQYASSTAGGSTKQPSSSNNNDQRQRPSNNDGQRQRPSDNDEEN